MTIELQERHSVGSCSAELAAGSLALSAKQPPPVAPPPPPAIPHPPTVHSHPPTLSLPPPPLTSWHLKQLLYPDSSLWTVSNRLSVVWRLAACCFDAYVKTDSGFADGWRRSIMAEGRRRPELRLHVQAADHREQLGGEDLLPLPVRGRLLHLRLRQHCRDWLQSEDCVQTGQAGQVANMGELHFFAMLMRDRQIKLKMLKKILCIKDILVVRQIWQLWQRTDRQTKKKVSLQLLFGIHLIFLHEPSKRFSTTKTFELQILIFARVFKYDELWKSPNSGHVLLGLHFFQTFKKCKTVSGTTSENFLCPLAQKIL